MNAFDRHTETEPTRAQRTAAFRNLCIGCVLGIVIGKVAEGVLDPETLVNPLWVYGRYLTVILFGWIGWLVGVGKERVVSENIECLAIAVVMALILKYFLVEAYKIPTGSMQPTILGNESAGIFDRVLVNKFAFLVDEPKRYDVIVFKYPLNRSQNYIKRCVGIGPERVTIQNGNIYSEPLLESGEYGQRHVARKPDDVRGAVLKTLYPSSYDGETFAAGFTALQGRFAEDGDTVTFDGPGAFRFKHDGESVMDRYLDGYDPSWGIRDDRVPSEREYVGDLAIDAAVTPASATKEIRFTIASNSLEHRAILGVGEGTKVRIESGRADGGSDALTPLDGQPKTLVGECDSPLRAGSSHRVEFFHVDQEVRLSIDGETLLSFEYEIGEPLPGSENRVEVSFDGGVEIEDLRVLRDIHYITMNGSTSQSFDVPANHVFGMGDNTQNSHDGRQWKALKIRLPNGIEITRDSNQDMRHGVTDIYGEHWDVNPFSNLQSIGEDNANYHFIPRSFLLGKALAVFWPIYHPFRWKLIR